MKIRKPVRTVWNALARKGPIESQLIITRRCNLSCGYCTEFDNHSPAIPLDTLKERIDALHRLRTAAVTLLGGEPLLHPDLPEIVRYTRAQAFTSIITNGFLFTEEAVDALNEAELDHVQISVDAMNPTDDQFIQKSLKSVRRRLEMLRDRARFSVHVNAVLCPQSVEEFPLLVEEVNRLGFPMTAGLVHDDEGRIDVQGEPYLSAWEAFYRDADGFSAIERDYGRRLLEGERPDWHCRAGARYLYVDEFGNVQYCASQRGRLDKSVTEYTAADLEEQRGAKKGCESGCTIACAHRCSAVDNDLPAVLKAWARGEARERRRSQPTEALAR